MEWFLDTTFLVTLITLTNFKHYEKINFNADDNCFYNSVLCAGN